MGDEGLLRRCVLYSIIFGDFSLSSPGKIVFLARRTLILHERDEFPSHNARD